jgi:RNA polymerase sigma factor (TIGR02999 family)
MASAQTAEITSLLRAWAHGDQEALSRLTPLVYDELHRMAKAYMRRERSGRTLQTTALVHETYLRLVNTNSVEWQDRAHFFAVSARMMRRILVDMARGRGSFKRGGRAKRVDFDKVPEISNERARELVEVDESLNILEKVDPRKARVIELRFFGGLSVEETAEVLKISPQCVLRDWKLAKAFLMRELTHSSGQL